MNRPDLLAVAEYSYACGLPRHWKETRQLVEYIEYLEQKLTEGGAREKPVE